MKQFFILFFLFGAIATGIYSCNKKSCDKVFCGSNRQCFEGECYCADGLEGDSCNQYANKKYARDYIVYETQCQGGQGYPGGSPYQTHIDSFPNYRYRLRLSNFLNMGIEVTAYIRTDKANRGNSIEIPQQNLGGIQVYGVGTYSPMDRRITMNIEYSVGSVGYACTHVFYPQ
ncbi:MAG: hypothetical protein M9931_04855 [Chitinophagales bacterium]|nr:hypothetical protein [Chitinophagales bacterium]OJV25625.1 MAG: hypothetical protein BGO32_01035 [Bacteroidetes bacterium 37-13]